LPELRAALLALPKELVDEASDIVEDSAQRAAADIIASYPSRTGNLRKGIRVSRRRLSNFAVLAFVVQRAPHAWIFEHGTQARHNAIGANRGSMPPGWVFVPRVMRYRAEMYRRLAAMVERHGLEVTYAEAA
jgi:hypothetical protein